MGNAEVPRGGGAEGRRGGGGWCEKGGCGGQDRGEKEAKGDMGLIFRGHEVIRAGPGGKGLAGRTDAVETTELRGNCDENTENRWCNMMP